MSDDDYDHDRDEGWVNDEIQWRDKVATQRAWGLMHKAALATNEAVEQLYTSGPDGLSAPIVTGPIGETLLRAQRELRLAIRDMVAEAHALRLEVPVWFAEEARHVQE